MNCFLSNLFCCGQQRRCNGRDNVRTTVVDAGGRNSCACDCGCGCEYCPRNQYRCY